MSIKLCFVAPGRSGKDCAADYLGKITTLKYSGSASNVVCPLIAKELGISEEQCWNERHDNRTFWKNWCDNFRKDDPAKIVKQMLLNGNLVVGLRGYKEIIAAKELTDLVIWISNNRVAIDNTMEFGSEVCDIVVENHTTLEDYYKKLHRLANSLQILI